MRFEVECGSCGAALEVEVTLEPAEAVEAGTDPVRTASADELTLRCPKCGALVELTVPSGVEAVEVRLRG